VGLNVREKINQLKQTLAEWYDALSNRERKLVTLISSVFCVLFCGLIIYSASSSLGDKHKKIVQKEKQIAQIYKLAEKYNKIKRESNKDKTLLRQNSISLFSVLQGIADQLELTLSDLNERKQVLPGEKIVEVSVAVDFKKVSLDRVTAFIKSVETFDPNGFVRITKLKIKSRFDQPDMLDVQMTVSTWKAA